MLYFASMRCASSGSFLGAAFINEVDCELAMLQAGDLVPVADGHALEVCCVPVPASNSPIPAIGVLLSLEDLERAGLVASFDVPAVESLREWPSHFALGRPLWDG